MTGLQLEFTLIKSCRVPAAFYNRRDLESLGRFVLEAEKVRGAIELSLDFVTPARIRQLNRHFRGVDRTTDVISFRTDPMAGPRGNFQGDIAINVEQAQIQAKNVGHSVRREIRLLWIHGILHLLGYTDYDPIPRRKMFKRQNALLRRWERK